jgi:hypothetical protein
VCLVDSGIRPLVITEEITMKRACAALVLLCGPVIQAQTAPDPSGHWQGSVSVLNVRFEVDLGRDPAGRLRGTVTLPDEQIAGLPITVTAQDRSLRFHARADQAITGVLSADGQTMAATYVIEGHELPFTLTRTGDSRLEPLPAHPPVARALEGTWTASSEGGGQTRRSLLVVANQPDGTAIGRIINLDQGRLEIPASAMTSTTDSLNLEFKSIGASYRGVINAEGTAIAGTYRERDRSVPLTFVRAAADSAR